MLGEAWAAIGNIRPKLERIKDERELLALRGEEAYHPFVLKKKLDEYDRLIEAYEDELADWENTYSELVAYEAEELASYHQTSDDPFREIFDELCHIEGIRIRVMDQLG